MLNVLYKDHTNTTADMTFKQTLLGIRAMLKQGSYDQIPQLSSSRPMDIDSNFDLAPEKCKGTRRAVMIGYVLLLLLLETAAWEMWNSYCRVARFSLNFLFFHARINYVGQQGELSG